MKPTSEKSAGGPSEREPESEPRVRRRELDAMLCELLELEAETRRERLAEIDDAATRSQLARLLDAALDPHSFLVPGGAASPRLLEQAVASLDLEGREIGPYRLLEEIGRGGMGVVYLAERADGRFDRRVAIKVVRMDTGSPDRMRFAREQQILARLSHPGIARLYDGGVTAQGESYFVMEHVEGVAIDRYVEDRRQDGGGSTFEERLRLAVDVCAAVAAAHRQLVVHGDLKPANILVDSDGGARLLDFGIARLESAEADAAPRGVARLTLQYASPEQLRGESAGTASDVYQLGLLLYELVTGGRPYELADLSLPRAREVVESRPLPALGDRAGRRPPRRRDLEAIVDRALAPDPRRRYSSAERLQEDLERYLEGRPVRARRRTVAYAARRFAGRHPWALAMSSSALVLVVVLSVVFTLRLARERDATRVQARLAEHSRAESEQVVSFLNSLFRLAGPMGSGAGDLTARELLERGAERLDGELAAELAGQPLVEARLLSTLGDLFAQYGELERARGLLEKSLELRREAGAAPHILAESWIFLAELERLEGNAEAAQRQLDRALAALSPGFLPALGSSPAAGEHGLPLYSRALNTLGLVHMDQGRYETAIEVLRRALALRRRLGDRSAVAECLLNLSNPLTRLGRIDEARDRLEGAVRIYEELYGPGHVAVAVPLGNLAILESAQGAHAEAARLNEKALEVLEPVYGGEHPRVLTILVNLGNNYSRLGENERAKDYLLQALRAKQRAGGRGADIGRVLNNLGSVAWRSGLPAEAESYYRRALEHTSASLPAGHPMRATLLYNLGEAVYAQDRLDEAEDLLLESRRLFAAALGDGHALTGPPTLYLAKIADFRGDIGRAEELFRGVLERYRAAESVDPELVEEAERAHEDFLRWRGSPPESPR